MIAAVTTAREREIPFLGTCGGFQHAILELARDLAGSRTRTTPSTALTDTDVIVELECSLVGHEGPIHYTPGTLIARDRRRRAQRRALPLRLRHRARATSSRSSAPASSSAPTTTTARRARWSSPDHPFFLGTLFQPELAGDGTRAHPVIRAFAEAVVSRRARGSSSPAAQLA